MLANAVASAIWERGWQDQILIDTRSDGATFADYRQKSLELETPYAEVMRRAVEITGVPQADIEQAAAWIARPKADGHRNRALTIYEKGMMLELQELRHHRCARADERAGWQHRPARHRLRAAGGSSGGLRAPAVPG